MNVPEKVSGRTVTRRGVHLAPHGFPSWVGQAGYWVGLLQSMHMSWVVLISESDAAVKSGAARALLDGGIIPIIRFACKVPQPFTEMAATEELVALYAQYNVPCIIQWYNEPFDAREAYKKWPPADEDEAWHLLRDRWNSAARMIVERGAFAGFPDGPCYSRNPFAEIGDPNHFWQDGKAVYLTHNYGKGRPVNYPLDDVSRLGTPLTMEEYRAALDDYADDPAWNEGPAALALMNQQRRQWANPQASPLSDDTCWLGWMKTQNDARQAFGFDVLMALTEGGWVPRDRAGSNPTDIRWPYTTPKMVGKLTLEAVESESPFFAICPWLLACREMGGSGWEFDAWVGGAYAEKYGMLKPVVTTLQQNPPGSIPGPEPEPDNWALLYAKLGRITELLEVLRART